MSNLTSPWLFKISKTGATQVWRVIVEGAKVSVEYGQEGGKMTIDTYVAKPKNEGRSNATTAEEQALLEAKAKVEDRKQNKQYSDTREAAREHFESCTTPMKIENYSKKAKNMTFPAYVQRKFNGSRLTRVSGKFYGKSGREESLNEILAEKVAQLPIEYDFDAEVYCHGLSLQEIRSAFLKPNKNTPYLRIYIFDVPVRGKPFSSRRRQLIRLKEYIKQNDLGYIFHVEIPEMIVSAKDYDEWHNEKTYNKERGMVSYTKLVFDLDKDGNRKYDAKKNPKMKVVDNENGGGVVWVHYEGTVIRKIDSFFEFGQRSMDTMKRKDRQDAEAYVYDVEKDKLGEGKLHCRMADKDGGLNFTLKMKVDRRDGHSYPRDYETMQGLIGQWITYSYEELSDKGIPTKPVGEHPRKCDGTGEPLE